MSLKGKCAVITGSSRGIGRGIALKLAAAGANVALVDRFADGDVTSLFRTGDELRVDPAAGLVEILSRDE